MAAVIPASADRSEPARADAGAAPPVDFETVFEQELSFVAHALRRLGVFDRDVEDVTHEMFLTVHRLLPTYDPRRPLRPWLTGIAVRFAADYRRRAVHRRETMTDAVAWVADAAPPADEQLAAQQDRALVVAALDTLELDRRAVFVMHEIDGSPVPEIAEALAIPLNTAYSRLRAAREQFTAAVRRLQLQRGAR